MHPYKRLLSVRRYCWRYRPTAVGRLGGFAVRRSDWSRCGLPISYGKSMTITKWAFVVLISPETRPVNVCWGLCVAQLCYARAPRLCLLFEPTVVFVLSALDSFPLPPSLTHTFSPFIRPSADLCVCFCPCYPPRSPHLAASTCRYLPMLAFLFRHYRVSLPKNLPTRNTRARFEGRSHVQSLRDPADRTTSTRTATGRVFGVKPVGRREKIDHLPWHARGPLLLGGARRLPGKWLGGGGGVHCYCASC